jgi:hypothetical protein
MDELASFAVLDQEPGNAVPLYWPAGINDERGQCPHFRAVYFDDPTWDTDPGWRVAAECGRIEELTRAARMTDMDLTGWLSGLDPATAPGSSSWFGIHRGPYEDL